ncbi:hypothetical protein DFH08DRAFT_711816, partial [Mycena albidolilacea]
LTNLFSGTAAHPIRKLACCARVVSEEGLYMELHAAEHNDEEPNAGALEGSRDDYEG